MVKHSQTIRRVLPMNCLSAFGHVLELAFKGLSSQALKNELFKSLILQLDSLYFLVLMHFIKVC